MASKIVSLILQAKNKLSPNVEKATKSIKDMSAETAQLERDLAKFENAQVALASLDAAAKSAEEAKTQFDAARTKVNELKASFKANKTNELALALDDAKLAAREAKKEWEGSAKVVKRLDTTLKQAGIEIESTIDAEKLLAAAVEDATNELAGQNKKLKKTKTGFNQAGTAANNSSTGVKKFIASAAGLVGITVVLDKIKNGFKSLATSVFQTGDQFELLSKRLNADELKFIEDFARNSPLQLDGVAQSFIRLRAFGIDPTLGAMQALTDQNAALGGGQAELEGIINAVGQAWAKQKLQSEEILQLVERGVPAWDLLAKVTGKSTKELSKLSEQGKLGRKEIKLLVEEIGRANQGEAAKAMSTLSGIVSNLKDDLTAFYRRVADNGSLDSLKTALVEVREEIKEMSDDGRLEKFAVALSNFFTSSIKWGQAAAKSFHDNFGAVYGAAQLISNSVGLVFNSLQAGVSIVARNVTNVVAKLADLAGFDEFAIKAQAATDAFRSQFDSAIADVKNNLEGLKDGAEALPQTFTEVATSFDVAKKSNDELNKSVDENKKSTDKATESNWKYAESQEDVSESLDKTKEKVEEVSEGAKTVSHDVGGVAAALAKFFNGVSESVHALSSSAGAAFNRKLGIDVKPVLDEIDLLKEGINGANADLSDLARDNLKVFDVTGINTYKNSVLKAQSEVEISYNHQKIKFLEYMEAVKSGEGVNQGFINSARNSIRNMDLLGQQDLAQLRSALDSANQKLNQMNENASNTLDGLKNELDQLQGNQDAIDQRSHDKKREELNKAIEEAKQYGNKEAVASYTEALRVLDQVRKEKKAERKEQANSKPGSTPTKTNDSASSSTTTINLQSPSGSKSVELSGDKDSVDKLLDVLEESGLRAG